LSLPPPRQFAPAAAPPIALAVAPPIELAVAPPIMVAVAPPVEAASSAHFRPVAEPRIGHPSGLE